MNRGFDLDVCVDLLVHRVLVCDRHRVECDFFARIGFRDNEILDGAAIDDNALELVEAIA
jgi:hypothetical protein